MQTKRVRKRSLPQAPKAPAAGNLTVLVQTHVSESTGRILEQRLEKLGRIKQSQYLRTLIERDLGLIP